jgi:hypothetical protein
MPNWSYTTVKVTGPEAKIDLNIVAKIMEKTAATCREIMQSGDGEALQNFNPHWYVRGLMHLASMLTRGEPVGLAESDDETVRDFTEITLAMGGAVDSESDPPWVMFNPPDHTEQRDMSKIKIGVDYRPADGDDDVVDF